MTRERYGAGIATVFALYWKLVINIDINRGEENYGYRLIR